MKTLVKRRRKHTSVFPIRTAAVGLLVIGLLSGCAGAGRWLKQPVPPGSSARSEAGIAGPESVPGGTVRPAGELGLSPFEHAYSREQFITAIVQLDMLREIVDHFDSFRWGDVVFEDYLASILWVEEDPLFTGRGIRMDFFDEAGIRYQSLTRGWVIAPGDDVSGIDEKPGVWKMIQDTADHDFLCEVAVNRAGIPASIRIRDTASGELLKKEAFYSGMLGQTGTSEADEGDLPDTSWFDEIRREEYEARITNIYSAMDIVGEEAIMIAGRWVRAVQLRSGPDDDRNTLIGWFSPDVPGMVLRIIRGDGQPIAQAGAFIDRYRSELYLP